ncbi:DUF2971 domain-containing protein [Polymorphobacter megasporae]|uniref:DUF2971 domain-containing protein n=1 Tax=Glacieibacterium megasporae TaxID=2835787 RepID=UPI001C1E25BC|nr:DUF2971 domain-containing protein [Polymorphobacter megasporae]UAJ10322.1 DUF2971 domain-containing protein [Polymorphobacter megasporae]
MTDEDLSLARIFLPHAVRQIERVRSNRCRFAHYTSAETGQKILRSQRVLLRNSTLMNDFSEIRHGWNCLQAAYNGPLGVRLQEAIRAVQPDLPEILQSDFNAQIYDVMGETYLMSVCEHGEPTGEVYGDGHEDKFGRLSMWRAYAPKNGVAFIMNHDAFLCETNALGAFTSPVAYAMPDDFQPAFEEVVLAVEKNIETLKPLGGKFVYEALMNAFRFAVQSTKHPAFREEREWRIIYSPLLLSKTGALTDQQMARIPSEIMSLGGVPQRTYAIPFVD